MVFWRIKLPLPFPVEIAIMSNKKRVPFYVYEDTDDKEQQDRNDESLCSPRCHGCSYCSKLLRGSLKRQSDIITNNSELRSTNSGLISDSLFQTSSTNESSTTMNSQQSRSISTTNATKSSSPLSGINVGTTFSDNESQKTTTPFRPPPLPPRKSPASSSRQNLFYSPTRDLVNQQRSSRSPRYDMRAQQSSSHSNSSSLTGSQDSVIPLSPLKTPVGKRSPRESPRGVRTHADKVRAALACPVHELPGVKYKSPKKTSLRKKVGLLWEKVQVQWNFQSITWGWILNLPHRTS